MTEVKLFIDGQARPAQGGRTSASIDPATEQPWATVAAAGEADLQAAVAAARAAADEGPWPRKSRNDRADVLDAVAEAIFEHEERLTEAEIRDGGSTLTKATTADVPTAAQCFSYFAEVLRERTGVHEFDEEVPVPSTNLVVEEPYGVCGLIVPWNFAVASAAMKVAPALAAGNAVVLKPSPHTPVSALMLAEIAHAAGVPDGVFNCVAAPEDTLGAALVAHPAVDKVAFTGSTRVGKRVMAAAADTLKPLTLELGGKSPSLVLDDADFDVTVPGLLFGTFFHGGQICTSGTRILAPASRYGELVERLVEAADRIVVGDPWEEATNIGPLAFEAHRANVERYVALGLEAGAKVARGGRRPRHMERGWYYEPTILTGVDNSMPVAREEIFGPVVCVIPYDDEEEALRIANDTPYGLAASVWSADLQRARRCADRIQAGTVWINDYHLLNVRFPFGGRKGSGFGCEFSPWGLTEYVTLKHLHIGDMGDPQDKFYTDMLLPPA